MSDTFDQTAKSGARAGKMADPKALGSRFSKFGGNDACHP